MTMPDERSRALVWAGGLLKEIAMDTSLPVDLRRRAVAVARHFPTIEQIEHMFIEAEGDGSGVSSSRPSEHPEWAEECQHGPLTYWTRLGWPTDA